jgi:hypothetical protein
MGQPELAAPPQEANLTGAKFQEARLDGAQLQNAHARDLSAGCQQRSRTLPRAAPPRFVLQAP